MVAINKKQMDFRDDDSIIANSGQQTPETLAW